MSEFETVNLYFKQVYTCKTQTYNIKSECTIAQLYDFITPKAYSDDFGIDSHYKIEIVEALLSKDIRIDVLDENNRTLLYIIIKFSYIEILKLFIKKNKETISLNIFEIKDNDGNIALFYAIKFNNLEIVKLILENSNNFLIKNYNGENALHLTIINNHFEIYKLIINYNKL